MATVSTGVSTQSPERSVKDGQVGEVETPVDPADERKGPKRSSSILHGILALRLIALFVVCFVLLLGAREVWRRPPPKFAESPLLLYHNPDPPPPPAPATAAPPHLTFYFDNGAPELSTRQNKELIRFAAAASACGNPRILVTGWVSSASFSVENETRNYGLAMNRANSARRALETKIPAEFITVRGWRTLTDISAELWYVDTRSAPKVENQAEYFNRRVDIELRSATCRRQLGLANATANSK